MLVARRIAGARVWGQAVNFDGTNDYLTRGAVLTGLPNNNGIGTLSFWIRAGRAYTAVASGGAVIATGSTFDHGLCVQLANSADGRLQIRGSDKNGNGVLDLRSNTVAPISTIGAVYHVLASFNPEIAGSNKLYINDANQTNLVSRVDAAFGWAEAGANFAIGALANGTTRVNGDLGEIWFHNTYIDLSVQANRRKFITAAGKPADLGINGEKVMGTRPQLYMAGPPGQWNTGVNRGTGGNFTIHGAVTSAVAFT